MMFIELSTDTGEQVNFWIGFTFIGFNFFPDPQLGSGIFPAE